MIYYDFCAKLQKSIVSTKEKGELFFFYQRKAVPLHPNHPKIRYATITTYCNYWWGCRRILCGEVLDIDAITGDFNLQAAWTTGYVVGQHIGE